MARIVGTTHFHEAWSSCLRVCLVCHFLHTATTQTVYCVSKTRPCMPSKPSKSYIKSTPSCTTQSRMAWPEPRTRCLVVKRDLLDLVASRSRGVAYVWDNGHIIFSCSCQPPAKTFSFNFTHSSPVGRNQKHMENKVKICTRTNPTRNRQRQGRVKLGRKLRQAGFVGSKVLLLPIAIAILVCCGCVVFPISSSTFSLTVRHCASDPNHLALPYFTCALAVIILSLHVHE